MAPNQRIQVLDGGMGTTLEALGADVSTALWGCDLLQTSPETIRNVHQKFTEAGADIIQTATYQLTLPALCAHAKLDESAAGGIMRSAIPLASTSSSQGKIALSIGPFGATLSPGQEYAGIYPAPYGPASSSVNYFEDGSARHAAVEALKEFHLSRLLTFSEDASTWEKVDWIAFETIPILTEYLAIRQAMSELGRLGRGKKFWISSAYPNGIHPQQMHSGHAGVNEVLMAALGGHELAANGVGVNCTNPAHIEKLAEDFKEALLGLEARGRVEEGDGVTFVLYPDGGSVYDVVTRTWSSGALDTVSWGKQVGAIARKVEEAEEDGHKVWDGVIVGGCCKAGFEEIKALRKALDE